MTNICPTPPDSALFLEVRSRFLPMSWLLSIPSTPLLPACGTDTASATISHLHCSLSSLRFSSPLISSGQVNNPHIILPCEHVQAAGWALTFVVHVGGDLHHTEAQVDRQVIEMVVGLQEELSTQLYVIAHLVHFIDQHCVEVLILRERVNAANVNWGLQRSAEISQKQNYDGNVDIKN